MKIKTQYISPVSLWVVVRRRVLPSGLFIEPAWSGAPEDGMSGPVIFVSRLLAHAYAYLRNQHHGADDSNNWKAIPLQDFDLLEHAHSIDGPLNCMMAFGFSMETSTAVVFLGAPRIRLVPLPFNVPKDVEGVTFSFNQWVFDFMCGEWKALGLPNHEQELEATDELDDTTFDRLLQTAIALLEVCREPSGEIGPWAVFSTRQETWVAGHEESPALRRDLH